LSPQYVLAHFARIGTEEGIATWMEQRPAQDHDNVMEFVE
jgi:hypothetical protein